MDRLSVPGRRDALWFFGGRRRKQLNLRRGDWRQQHSFGNPGPLRRSRRRVYVCEPPYGTWPPFTMHFLACISAMHEHRVCYQQMPILEYRFSPFYHETIPCLLERIGDFEDNIVDAVMLAVITARYVQSCRRNLICAKTVSLSVLVFDVRPLVVSRCWNTLIELATESHPHPRLDRRVILAFLKYSTASLDASSLAFDSLPATRSQCLPWLQNI